jgi:error-prone DNA polymerase
MVVAGFSGGEAEELRRAMGFQAPEKRMREIEVKLRAGMERNGITREAQEQIVLSITSFALYGFSRIPTLPASPCLPMPAHI